MPMCIHASPAAAHGRCQKCLLNSRKLLYAALLMISNTDTPLTLALAMLVLASGRLWCVRAVLL